MPSQLRRRTMLGLMAGAGLGVAAQLTHKALAAEPGVALEVQSARFSLVEGTVTDGLVSTRPDGPPPVIRMRRNSPFLTRVTNRLDD